MDNSDQLWMDSYGFVYSADGKRMLKGADVRGAYWIPEGVEEIEPGALLGCRIDTLHIPWTAHVHDYGQLVFSEDEEENENLMPCVYFWQKDYSCRDEQTDAFEDDGEYRMDENDIAYSLDRHRLLFARAGFKDNEYGIRYMPPICYTVYPSISPSDWRFCFWLRWRKDNCKRLIFLRQNNERSIYKIDVMD